MKILVLDNFFNFKNFQGKFRRYYKALKLKGIIRKIRKQYNDAKIEIITESNKKFNIDKDIEVQLLSEYRIKVDRVKFLNIKNKIIKKTKENLISFYKYHFKSKMFHLKGILIPKIIDFSYTRYFNSIFGEFELLKCIFEEKKFDKVIVFNSNLDFFKFFNTLNSKIGNKIEIFSDSFLDKKKKLLQRFFSNYFISLLAFSIRNSIFNKKYKKSYYRKKKELNKNIKNIIFSAANTENQYRSLKPIYDEIKVDKRYNPIFFIAKNFIPVLKLTQLIRFLFRVNKILKESRKKIIIEYDSLKLRNFFLTYDNSKVLFKFLVVIFNNLCHFDQFIKYFYPSLVIFADDERIIGKLCVNNCNRKGITTLYIPHAAVPFNPLDIIKKKFNYSFVPGEKDKEYLVSMGLSENNIFVTGRPRYKNLYEGKIKKLNNVRDMYTDRIYEFDKNKFTILFTTNPIDYKTNKKLITGVLRSLKELNLLDNLIIKLHPREYGLFHKGLIDQMNVSPIIVQDVEILDLIKSSDLLLSRVSTTILESITIGTPVIVLDDVNSDFRFSDTLLFTREKSLLTIRNQGELIEIIKSFIKNRDYLKEYTEKLRKLSIIYCPKRDVNPIKKSIKLINKIMEKQ